MSMKKGTRAGTAIPARAVENGSVCETAQPSTSNDTIAALPGQAGIISRLLSHGQENAVPLKQLTTLTGLPERVVRRQIAAERKRGTMILADNKSGYFLPGTPEELRRFSRSMIHRASEIMAVARLAENAFAEALGQSVMEGWQDNE